MKNRSILIESFKNALSVRLSNRIQKIILKSPNLRPLMEDFDQSESRIHLRIVFCDLEQPVI